MASNFNFAFFCDNPDNCDVQLSDPDVIALTDPNSTVVPQPPTISNFKINKPNNIVELSSTNDNIDVTFIIEASDNGSIKQVKLTKGNNILKNNLEIEQGQYKFTKNFKYNDYNLSSSYETYKIEVVDNLGFKTTGLLTITINKIIPPVISNFSSNQIDNKIILNSVEQIKSVIFNIEIKESDGNLISSDRVTNVKVKKNNNNIIEPNLTVNLGKTNFVNTYDFSNFNRGLTEELFQVIMTDNKNQIITKDLIIKVLKDEPPIITTFESNLTNNELELDSEVLSQQVILSIEAKDDNGEVESTNSINNVKIEKDGNVVVNNLIINNQNKYVHTISYIYNQYSFGNTTENFTVFVTDNSGQISTKSLVLTIKKPAASIFINLWSDLSGKDNYFNSYLKTHVANEIKPPKIVFNSQNDLPGISFAMKDTAIHYKEVGLKLHRSKLNVIDKGNDINESEINNIKTLFCVFKDIDDSYTSSFMSSKGEGPPAILGSDASYDTSKGFTLSDFGTSHIGTETFWPHGGTQPGITKGVTRVNGIQFTGKGTLDSVKRSKNAGQATLMSVQIKNMGLNSSWGDSGGINRSGIVLSSLGNTRNDNTYRSNTIIYELIVYTGYISPGSTPPKKGTSFGNVGSDTVDFSENGVPEPDLIRVENYLKKKWNLQGANSVPSDTPDTLPDVSRTNSCILSLHLDASNAFGTGSMYPSIESQRGGNIRNENICDIYTIFKNSIINKDNNSSYNIYIEELLTLDKYNEIEMLKSLYNKAIKEDINNIEKLKIFLIKELGISNNRYFIECI